MDDVNLHEASYKVEPKITDYLSFHEQMREFTWVSHNPIAFYIQQICMNLALIMLILKDFRKIV